MKLTSKNRNNKILFWKTNLALAVLGCLSEGHSMMRSPCTGFPDSDSESDELVLNYGTKKAEKVLNPVIQEMFNVIQVSSSEDGQKATKYLFTLTDEQEDANAQYNLGYKYFYGKGVKQDYGAAFEYFNLAAQQGNANAQIALGNMYFYGKGVKQDYGIALKYCNLAAQQGNANAQSALGEMYFKGGGVKQDYGMALKYYNLAAQQGNANAQSALGNMYCYGEGVKQDYGMALKYYNLAAQQGNANAQSALGKMYFMGDGVKQDYGAAFEYSNLAAQQGDVTAQCALGKMYFMGGGVKQDYGMALKYFNLAAQQGDVTAQSALGEMYFKGGGVKQDYGMALKYYNLAAQQGDETAQYNLGIMYYSGVGTKQDYGAAFEYFNRAAQQGDVTAQYNLGVMYSKGDGVKQDYGAAFEYFNRAAQQGNAEAQANLGEMYYNGLGVEQDYGLALRCFRQASEQGIIGAKLYIAEIESIVEVKEQPEDKPIETEGLSKIIEITPSTKKRNKVLKILDLKSSSLLHKRFSKDKEHKKKKSSPSLVSEGTESIIQPFMTESEQFDLSEMSERSDCSEHSESIKSKILKIKKPSKILWNDTTEKSGKEKKAQKKEKASSKRRSMIISQLPVVTASISQRDISERSSVSKSERSEVETPLSTNTIELLRAQVEAKLAEGHFNELVACFGRDIKNLAQVVLTEDAILKTLKKLKNIDVKDILKDLDLKNPSIIKYTDKKTTVHAVFRSGHTNPPAFTAHKHNHNLPWYEQKNVRDDFFGFLADCGLDSIKLIQLNQQVKPTKIILTHMDNEANAANSGGEED